MKRPSYSTVLFAAVLALGLLASGAAVALDGRDCVPPVHTPVANGVVIATRIFNDCPGSTLSFFDGYPGQIWIHDSDDGCVGWANLHVWSFSEDGGLTPAVFENCSYYLFRATLVLDPGGPSVAGAAEAGLRLSPWWSLDVDGRFMVRAGVPYGNGEIACYGGRLPFYSFTANYGVTYQNDMPAYLEIVYHPHSLTEAEPATIEYHLGYMDNYYTSGPLAFDQGTPSEDPPHGLWGELFPARAGGYFQLPNGNGGAAFDCIATWWGSGVVSVPGKATLPFALDPVRPNPSRGGVLTVHFTLPNAGAASLELLDVAGRRIARREVGSLGGGYHSLDLGEGRRLAPGLYLVCLRQGTNTRVTRVAVLK
jgi:hypothetical protein